MNDTDLATAGTAAQTRPTCSMCGAVVNAIARCCLSCGEPLVSLVRRSRLRRTIAVTLPEGCFFVEYEGTSVRKLSLTWFVPRFEFDVGGHAGSIEIRVALWLAVRSFDLRIDNILVYTESRTIPPTRRAVWAAEEVD